MTNPTVAWGGVSTYRPWHFSGVSTLRSPGAKSYDEQLEPTDGHVSTSSLCWPFLGAVDTLKVMAEVDFRQEPFPAPSRHATGLVNGVETEVCSMNFSDKIMVTISQEGRLAQWVCQTFFNV